MKTNYLKAAVACIAFAGIVQATPVTLTKLWEYSGDETWQDIKSVSCSFTDSDNDNILEVGEAVTFTVVVEKDNWGTHNYDALKIWVDALPGVESPYLATENFVWDYNLGVNDYTNERKYSSKDWKGGTQSFSQTVTFNTAGDYAFAASVMCSRDLATLSSSGNVDNPVSKDWDAWYSNIHQDKPYLQGEDKAYKITVYAQNVPEPGILTLLGCGILSLAFFRRKK
jgi:hypothetical protein